MSLPITAFASREAAMEAAANALAEALAQGLSERGGAALALSGGSTPEPAYRLLAQRGFDWRRVSFGLVDERWAPPNDPASNEAMLRRALAPALDKGALLLPMWRAAASPDEAAAQADQVYAGVAFDAALMGMGADGHTASWFPGADRLGAALEVSGTRTVMALRASGAAGAAERLTLTRAALRRIGRIVLLITGEEKKAVLERAVGAKAEAAPVSVLVSDFPDRLSIYWAP